MSLDYDYQIHLVENDLLLGNSTRFTVGKDIKGIFGVPQIRVKDLEFSVMDGSAGGIDTYSPRVITIPVTVWFSSPAQARENMQEIIDKWQVLRAGVTALDIRIPGTPETTMRFYGRPRDIAEAEVFIAAGYYKLELTFDALDPLAYGAATTVANSASSPITITNNGNFNSRRCVLRAHGNGSIPLITNTSDPDGGFITFTEALPLGQYYDIDLYNMTVTHSSGGNRDQEVTIASIWMEILKGSNSITFSGCGSLEVTEFRPAWI